MAALILQPASDEVSMPPDILNGDDARRAA
jgi:hypothetical protein